MPGVKKSRSLDRRASESSCAKKEEAKTLDSGFRRNDKLEQRQWIPAFAGMTAGVETHTASCSVPYGHSLRECSGALTRVSSPE